jgi:hypothetical protein
MADHGKSALETAHLWADLASKVLGGMAIVVAAWWTYTNFTVERTHDPTMLVSMTPSVHALAGDQVLLNVDVFMENIGKVAIKPRFPADESGRDVLKRNLLAANEDYRHGRYQLNPGVRYREPFACVVERGRLYAIRARFWTAEGSVADLVYVDTFHAE